MATTKFNLELKLKFHKIVEKQANGIVVTFTALHWGENKDIIYCFKTKLRSTIVW
jgi:hypothetical protein